MILIKGNSHPTLTGTSSHRRVCLFSSPFIGDNIGVWNWDVQQTFAIFFDFIENPRNFIV